jgi:hypothetical protein
MQRQHSQFEQCSWIGNSPSLCSVYAIATVAAAEPTQPIRFDWQVLRAATDGFIVRDDLQPHTAGPDTPSSASASSLASAADPAAAAAAAAAADAALLGLDEEGMDGPEALDRVLRFSYRFGGGLTLVLVVAWPLLALPAGDFSLAYWTLWVAVAFLWGHLAAAVTILLPLWEGRAAIRAALGLPVSPPAAPGAKPLASGGGGGGFVELEAFRLADAAGRFGAWLRPAGGKRRGDDADGEDGV